MNDIINIDGVEYISSNILSKFEKSDVCPNCGAECEYFIIDSRPYNGNRIRRKRCKYCGKTWQTIEQRYDTKKKPIYKGVEE